MTKAEGYDDKSEHYCKLKESLYGLFTTKQILQQDSKTCISFKVTNMKKALVILYVEYRLSSANEESNQINDLF